MKDKRHLLPLSVIVIISFVQTRNIILNDGFPFGMDTISFLATIVYFSKDSYFVDIYSDISIGTGTPVMRVLSILLASIVHLIDNHILFYKIFFYIVITFSGISMYLFTFYNVKNEIASLISAIIYMSSPFFAGLVASAHINHMFAYMITPVLFLYLQKIFDESKKIYYRNVLIFGIFLSILALLRVDPVLLIFPFLIIFATIYSILHKKYKLFLKFIVISMPLFILTTLYIFYPLLFVIFVGSSYASVSNTLNIQQAYSLPLLKTIMGHGVPDAYGYIFWKGKLDYNTHPFLNDIQYNILMIIIPLFVFFTVILNRFRDKIISFSIILALSLYLAKGPNPPLESLYIFLYNHVPFFDKLTAPNRFLIITWFVYSFLFGIGISCLINKVNLNNNKFNKNIIIMFIIFFVISITFLIVPFIYISGYQTWMPSKTLLECYNFLDEKNGQDRIISIPYGQSRMFIKDLGLTNDIGRNSYMYHSKPVFYFMVRAQDKSSLFYKYTQKMVNDEKTSKLVKILGAYNVKYILINDYPFTQPLHPVYGKKYINSYDQHYFFENQSKITLIFEGNKSGYIAYVAESWANILGKNKEPPKMYRITTNRSCKIYKNQYFIPRIFSPEGQIVVIGGLDTFLKLAEMDRFNFSKWNLIFADHLVENSEKSVLIRKISMSDYVLFVNTKPLDLAMLLSNATWIKVNKFEKESYGWSFDDTPIIEGYAAYFMDVISANENNATAVYNLNVDRDGTYEVWVRVFMYRKGGEIDVRIDDRELRTVDAFSSKDIGFEWVKAGEVKLSKGEHKIKIYNLKGENWLNEIVIADKGEIERSEKLVKNMVGRKAIYLIDVEYIKRYISRLGTVYNEEVISDDYLINYWVPSQSGVELAESAIRASGRTSLRVDISPRPNPGEVIYTRFYDMQNWSGIKYISFWFKGSGKGESFNLWIYFNNSKWPNPDAVRFGPFYDTTNDWQHIVIPVDKPAAVYGNVMWDKVSRIVLAIPDKNFRGRIYIDRFSIYTGEINRSNLENALNSEVFLFKNSKPVEDYYIAPKSSGNVTDIEFNKLRPSKWVVKVNSTGPYVLVFSNTYHRMWRAYVNGKEYRSTPSYYFINSFYINETGPHVVEIEFIGQRIQMASLIISGLAYLFAISYLMYDWGKNSKWIRRLRKNS